METLSHALLASLHFASFVTFACKLFWMEVTNEQSPQKRWRKEKDVYAGLIFLSFPTFLFLYICISFDSFFLIVCLEMVSWYLCLMSGTPKGSGHWSGYTNKYIYLCIYLYLYLYVYSVTNTPFCSTRVSCQNRKKNCTILFFPFHCLFL